ncbi:hypothetical protein Mapa_002902 [Marchantia paleacea]|nr:hypothetical protein Mapa_002902 [Marchantia paleacea]
MEDYDAAKSCKENFRSMDHQAVVMNSSAENYEDKRSERMEGDNSTNEIVVHAKTACDPQTNTEPEPKAALHHFPFSGSVPEQNGSQATHDHDTSVPEPLTDVLRGEMGPLLGILDLYYVECLCSKQWQLRDKALQHIVKLLQSKGISGDPSSNLK